MKIFELLATWSVISVVVLSVTFASTRLARSSAALRHVIWVCAFGSLLLIPAACQFIPGRNVKAPVQEFSQLDLNSVESVGAVDLVPASVPFNWQPVQNASIALWLVGALAFGAYIARGVLLASAMKRASSLQSPEALGLSEASQKSGVRRAWELRVSFTRRPPAAMTWGWLKPVVMLPKDSASWPTEKCETVLLHELAHVRRHDSFTQFVALAVCALYWFNPLVWLAARAMRLEAEKAADDRVILAGVRPTDYAAELLRIASEFGAGLPRQPMTHIGVSIMKQPKIESRIRSIVDPANRHRGVARFEVVSVASVALAAVLALIALRPGTAMAQSTQLQQPATILVKSGPDSVKAAQTPKTKAKRTKLKRATKSHKKPISVLIRVRENGKDRIKSVTLIEAGRTKKIDELTVNLAQTELEIASANKRVHGAKQTVEKDRSRLDLGIENEYSKQKLNIDQVRLAEGQAKLAEREIEAARATGNQQGVSAEKRKLLEYEVQASKKMSADRQRQTAKVNRLIELEYHAAKKKSVDRQRQQSKVNRLIELEYHAAKKMSPDQQKRAIELKRNAELDKGNAEVKDERLQIDMVRVREEKLRTEKEKAESDAKRQQDQKRADEEKARKKGGGDELDLAPLVQDGRLEDSTALHKATFTQTKPRVNSFSARVQYSEAKSTSTFQKTKVFPGRYLPEPSKSQTHGTIAYAVTRAHYAKTETAVKYRLTRATTVKPASAKYKVTYTKLSKVKPPTEKK